MLRNSNNAFTLIELLVVIAIIGILSSVVLASLSGARERARDTRRVQDIRQLETAIQQYYVDNNKLPRPADYGEENKNAPGGWWAGSWDVSSGDTDGDGIPFVDFLVEDGYLQSAPVDPVNEGNNGRPTHDNETTYFYYITTAGSSYDGGTANGKRVYMIGASNLETVSDPAEAAFDSGCKLLWKDSPNFFQQSHDYIRCGSY